MLSRRHHLLTGVVLAALLISSLGCRGAKAEASPTEPPLGVSQPTLAPTATLPAEPSPVTSPVAAEATAAPTVAEPPTVAPPTPAPPTVAPTAEPASGTPGAGPGQAVAPQGTASATTAAPEDETLSRARRAMHDGDYAAAIPLLRQALEAVPASQTEEVRVLLGRALYENDQYREAAEALAPLAVDRAPLEVAAQGLGTLARTYQATGAWVAAADAYKELLALDDSAEDMIRWEMANAYRAGEYYAEAVEQLRAIPLGGLSASRKAEVLEELGDVLADMGDYDGAIAAFEEILGFAQNGAYRGLLLKKQGDVQRDAGRYPEATALYHRCIREHPEAPSAALALDVLDEMRAAEVEPLERAVVYYHAGRSQESLDAIRAYQLAAPDGALDYAHYVAGLALHDMGRYDEAIVEFDEVIEHFATSAYIDKVWLAKAQALAGLGLDAAAFYARYAEVYPGGAQAASMLWRAAEYQERQRNWESAAYYYRLLRTTYPTDAGAREARFREALAAYAGGDAARAQALWGEALTEAAGAAESTRLLTWLGKASQKAGNLEAAAAYWRQAAETLPDTYYGLRAADLLTATAITRPGVGAEVGEAPLTDADWVAIEAWVRGWAQGAPGTLPDVSADPLVRRALLLWDLGWHTEATDALRAYRDAIQDDPFSLLSLGRLCDARGVAPFAIGAGERLETLAAAAGSNTPPPAALRLTYPTTYAHLISAEGRAWDVDPLLFLALVRQESRFDPQAHSWAGAYGLTQVMPATGQDIANALGVADYQHASLRRPVLGVRFGVYYLSVMLDLCDGDWVAALASYNGGYGNVTKWTGGQAIADHDLFYELVPYAETRSYIRLVYENYRMYQHIYGQ